MPSQQANPRLTPIWLAVILPSRVRTSTANLAATGLSGARDCLPAVSQALQAYDMSPGAPYGAVGLAQYVARRLRVGRTEEAFMCNQRALSLLHFDAALDVRKRILASFKVHRVQLPESVSWL